MAHAPTLLEFTPKQFEFAKAVFSGNYLYLLYGGAIRGGKSYCTLGLVILLSKIYAGSRWAVVRRDLPTLRRTTIPTFEKIKPDSFSQINQSTWATKCNNGSEILFFPENWIKDHELNRWRGLEVNGFVLEEANELNEASFNKSIERAGSWKCPGENQPQPLVLLTCNPSRNWVKRLFYDRWKKNTLQDPFFYLPAKVIDNPHLTKSYVDSLEHLKETDAKAYRRFVEGDWETTEDPDQLIQFEWILNARNVAKVNGKKRLGVDVARFGDDDTVLCHLHGNVIEKLEYYSGISIDRTAAIVQTRINDGPIDSDNVMVDVVGLGAGVADILGREGYEVVEVVSGAKAEPRADSFYSFKNLRSQLWWEFREKLRTGGICFNVEDHRLTEDLTAPRYSISSDKMITVESKDDIKKRIGRSTDAGDAVVYAFADIGGQDFSGIRIPEEGVRANPWVM